MYVYDKRPTYPGSHMSIPAHTPHFNRDWHKWKANTQMKRDLQKGPIKQTLKRDIYIFELCTWAYPETHNNFRMFLHYHTWACPQKHHMYLLVIPPSTDGSVYWRSLYIASIPAHHDWQAHLLADAQHTFYKAHRLYTTPPTAGVHKCTGVLCS